MRLLGWNLALWLVVLSVGHAAPLGATEPAALAADEATAVVDAFHTALKTGDTTAALVLLDDNVMIFEQGYIEWSKAEYASHHLASDAEFSKSVASKQIARRSTIEGGLAWVATESSATGKFKEKDVDSVSIETMVLRRTNDGWRIVHIHWSSRKAKA
jgi:ketosteroid isomerase-like protein